MVDDKERFVLTMTIKKGEEEHGHVYYKQDGQRFDYMCTIKMNVETHYTFTLTFRPAKILESASIQGSSVTLSAESSKDNCSVYAFDWFTSGICITKSSLREAVPLVLNVKNLGILTIMLQIKFYKAEDKSHSTWGNALHHIDYECSQKANQSFIDIDKEVYR